MSSRPADEARRALREALERREGAPAHEPAPEESAGREQAPEGQEQAAEESGRDEARPGDAARSALRRAVSAKRGDPAFASGDPAGDASAGSSGGEGDRPGDAPEPAPSTVPTRDGEADPQGARPGDVAREALRAARSGSRRTLTDAERAAAEAAPVPRRTARTAGRARRDESRRAAGVQARDVRELLAGAFQMPPTAAGPEAEPGSDHGAQEGSSSVRATAPSEGSETVGLTDNPADPHRAESAGPTTGRPPITSPATTSPATTSPATTSPATTSPPTTSPASMGGGSSNHPTSPRRPHSMAAPARDGDLRRTFPAFPARDVAGGGFAETWWGSAWVTALEEGALDAKRLARGRGYAEQGHVDAITVTPGLVLAYVQGSRPRPYRVQVRLRTLDDAGWERFLDAAVERPGHIAALLDKELPQSLADCGVPLLPGPGDLDPHCSCPDRGHPCKHAAALCYQTARLLDADSFVLLLLRGRGERELLDELSRLSAACAARAAQEQEPAPLPGVRASEAVARRDLPPLPPPLPVPPHPEQPPVYPAAPGGPDTFALDQLATDAAARAHALLGTGRDPVAELTLWQDAVRLAAVRPGSGLTAGTRALYASLASAAERTPADLARAVAAWRQGGLEGLTVLEDAWDPPAGRFDRARPLLLAADLPAFRPWRNRLTHPRGHVQLRFGRDGLWYAYESEPGHDDWWPRGTPDLDPVGALTGLGAPSDL